MALALSVAALVAVGPIANGPPARANQLAVGIPVSHRPCVCIVLVGALGLLIPHFVHAESIALNANGGVLTVPVRVNDTITLSFVVDSGAADVSITADLFSILRRAGTVSEADIIGYTGYEMADGSTQREPNFLIRSLRIGSVELQNVRCSVAPARGNLLLGQSFLARLPPWSIDFQRRVLILNENSVAPSTPTPQQILVPPTAPPSSSQIEANNDPDHACGAAQSFCRDGTYLCGVYRNDFIRAGRVCPGVTDSAYPASAEPNNDNDPDYSCRAAQAFCREGAPLCNVYRKEFQRAARICPGVTTATNR
jgi:aspartyl protease family protein